MNNITIFESVEETAVEDRAAISLAERAARSELLGEAAVTGSYSTSLDLTWATDKYTLVDLDLRAPSVDVWLTPLATEQKWKSSHTRGWLSALASEERSKSGMRVFWRYKTFERNAEIFERRIDPFEKANSDRVALLARKYVSKEKFADEDRARLAIQTERVRRLLPAVTAEELATLEAALNISKEAEDTDRELRGLLGLPPGA